MRRHRPAPYRDPIDEILTAIDSVDWPALSHAYGPATDTPGQLRALLNGDLNALEELDTSIYHQGGVVHPAAVPAVPIIIAMVCRPEQAHRRWILEDILASFARLLASLREPQRSRPETFALRDIMRQAIPRFAALLDDADPEVRAAAVGVLADYDTPADHVAGMLRDRFPAETNPHVRTTILLDLGEMARHLATGDRAEIAAWISETVGAERRPRLAALIARQQLVPGTVPAADIVEALADPALIPHDYLGRDVAVRDISAWLGPRVGDPEFPGLLARRALRRTSASAEDATAALAQAGSAMLRSRPMAAELLPDVAALLDHPDAKVRSGAAHLLAASGTAATPYLDRLTEALRGPSRQVTARAVWALALHGDAAVVADLSAAAAGEPGMFPVGGGHYRGDAFMRFPLTDLPSLPEVMAPMRAHAEQLIPAVRRRLARATERPVLTAMTKILTGYGPAAAAALPELRALLATEHHDLACEVLGALGPAAAETAADLQHLAPVSPTAAWAHFQVTGDPGLFLRHADFPQGMSTPHAVFRHLADLGPHARDKAAALAGMLAASPNHWPAWPGVEAAHAHWRITGDAALCLDVFDAALNPLRRGEQFPVSRQALRYLPELGPAADRFRALLADMVASPNRLRYSGGWRGLAEDDEAVSLAEAVLRS